MGVTVADLPPTLQRIPTARVGPIIRAWMTATGTDRKRLGEMLATDHESAKSVGWERRLWAIEHESHRTTTFRLVDAILCTIDRPDAWHNELADLFEVPAWTRETVGVCPDCGHVGTSFRSAGKPNRCKPCGRRAAAVTITTTVRPDTLRCSHCHEWLPDEAFARHLSKTHRRGRTNLCRPCGTIARRAYGKHGRAPKDLTHTKHSTAPQRSDPDGSRAVGQKEAV